LALIRVNECFNKPLLAREGRGLTIVAGAIKKEAWLRPIGAAHGVAVLGVRGHERMLTTSQKITVGEMREMGVRGLFVYCSDYKCSHSVALNADRWPNDVRLSDLQ